MNYQRVKRTILARFTLFFYAILIPNSRKEEGLHGLFSGMIISEMGEAEADGVETDEESMDWTNRIMFTQLRKLLDDGIPLHEIPKRLKTFNTIQSDLSRFNYERFYYM